MYGPNEPDGFEHKEEAQRPERNFPSNRKKRNRDGDWEGKGETQTRETTYWGQERTQNTQKSRRFTEFVRYIKDFPLVGGGDKRGNKLRKGRQKQRLRPTS